MSTTDLHDCQLRELCAVFGWQGGTYHQVLAEVKRAVAIADEAMFGLLETECIGQDDNRTVLGLTNDGQSEVARLVDATDAIREAFAWLQPRGYVRLSRDGSGEYIDVLRRPGDES